MTERNADVSKTLTEQWKKGELPNGWYYVRLIRGEYRIDLYINGKNEWIDCPDDIIDTVVCKVPSYEEWQASENYIDYLKQCISVYESKDKQATETSIAYNELLDENTKLKDLLKECKHIMSIEKDFASCHYEKDKLCKLLTKINQVLGEE